MDDKISQKTKTHTSELGIPIIPMVRSEKDELDSLECIDHMYHNTHEDTTLENYVIKIPRFDSDTPEE